MNADGRARFARSTKRTGAAMVAGAVALALALSGCTTVNSGGDSGSGSGDTGAKGSSGSAAASLTGQSDAAIRKIVNGRTLTVGFVPPILSEYYTQVEKAAWNEMAEYTKRFGVKWEWSRQAPTGDAHSGTDTPGIVNGFISRKFDAVLVCSAANAETMNPIYKSAAQQGTNIYQFNSTNEAGTPSTATDPTQGESSVTNVGYDNVYQSGYLAGKYIAEKLKGKGTIIQILGPSGSDWTKLRDIGFEKAIKEYPGLTIVGKADGGYVRDKGFTAAQDLLTKYPKVNAIYGENEEMALGGSQAIDAAGLKHWDGKGGIITIGADGLVSGMEAIKQGKLTATVDVNSVDMGHAMIAAIFAHEILGQQLDEFLRVPTAVVDKTNVDWHEAYIKEQLATSAKY
jgi:ABC-type sugar transport system substrate-binding protein